MLLLLGSSRCPVFYFFCAVNKTQPVDWFTAFTQSLYNIQMLAENHLEIKKKYVVKVRARNFEKQTLKFTGYCSHMSFDSQPVITSIVNELIDYCVRPGLIITSSIINDIIGEFETESIVPVNSQNNCSGNSQVTHDIA